MAFRIVQPPPPIERTAAAAPGGPAPPVPGDDSDSHFTPSTGLLTKPPPVSLRPIGFGPSGQPIGNDDPAPRNETRPAPRRLGLPSRRISLTVILGLLYGVPVFLIQILDLVPLFYEPLCRVEPSPGCFPWDRAHNALQAWTEASPVHFLLVRGFTLAAMLIALSCATGFGRRGRRSPRRAVAASLCWILLSFA